MKSVYVVRRRKSWQRSRQELLVNEIIGSDAYILFK